MLFAAFETTRFELDKKIASPILIYYYFMKEQNAL